MSCMGESPKTISTFISSYYHYINAFEDYKNKIVSCDQKTCRAH